MIRDSGRRFPVCTTKNHYVDGHHITHWADGGETCLSNLTSLCKFHHRLVHEGGFSVEWAANGALVFRNPEGRELSIVGTACSQTQSIEAINCEHGVVIDHATVYRQRDESIDYGMVIEGLVQRRHHA